jgi:hypothetical protein
VLGENQKCSNDVYVRSSQRADPDTSGVLQPGVILLNFVKNLKIRDVVRARGCEGRGRAGEGRDGGG